MSSPDPKIARHRTQGTMHGAAHPIRARTILRSGPHGAHDTPQRSGVARLRAFVGTRPPAPGLVQRQEMTASWCAPTCRSGRSSFQPARHRRDQRLPRPHRPESTDAPVIAPPIGYTAMSWPSLAMKPSLRSSYAGRHRQRRVKRHDVPHVRARPPCPARLIVTVWVCLD